MALISVAKNLSTTESDIYVCPTGTESICRTLVIGNQTANTQTATLKYYKSTTANTITLAVLTIAASSLFAYPVLDFQDGDKLIAAAGANSSLAINMSILEDTGSTPVASGFNPQGPYSAGTTYAVNDVVSSSGFMYISRVASNIGNTPASSPTQWMVFVVPVAGGVASTATGNVASTDVQSAIAELDSDMGELTDYLFCLAAS